MHQCGTHHKNSSKLPGLALIFTACSKRKLMDTKLFSRTNAGSACSIPSKTSVAPAAERVSACCSGCVRALLVGVGDSAAWVTSATVDIYRTHTQGSEIKPRSLPKTDLA